MILLIGGAEGKSAITALLKLVQGTKSEAASTPGTFAKKKSSGSQPLNRPLIAICNDLYAPALRPLRSIARLITFKQTQVLLPASVSAKLHRSEKWRSKRDRISQIYRSSLCT